MKSIIFFATLILFLGLFAGCKKEEIESEPIDYRESYTGSWEMTVVKNSTEFTTDMGGNSVINNYSDTTVYPEVMVSLDAETNDGVIIDLRPDVLGIPAVRVSVTEDGKFEKACSPTYSIVTGEFETENTVSLDLHEWGICGSYSAGGYTQQVVTGTKN